MVCSCHNFIFCLKPCYFSLLFLLILTTSQLRNKAQGRSCTMNFLEAVNEEKERLRAQIGSRLPRCERRCNSCKRCEAIQVPTNPSKSSSSTSISVSDVAAYERGDGNSNYKPMSWKCKCGNFIFNP